MEMTLKEYLVKFFGVKESFFENGIKSKVDFKGRSLGFVSSSLLSKISIGKSFIPLEKVFPSKKKIYLSYKLHPNQCRMCEFTSPNGTFKEAVVKFDKYQLDLKHDETPEDDFDEDKLLKKNKLTPGYGNYVTLNDIFSGWHEAYFHHDYEYSDFEIMDSHNLSRKNHFLLKKGKRIFYINTDSLEYVDFIGIKI